MATGYSRAQVPAPACRRVMQPGYDILLLADRPDLQDQVDRLGDRAWPRFFTQGTTSTGGMWPSLFDDFADCQILFCENRDTVVALGHTVPLVMDGASDLPSGVDTGLARAIENRAHSRRATTLCALAAIVDTSQRGRGLSKDVVGAMVRLAAARGLDGVIAPVRPMLKSFYPLTPFHDYIEWKLPDGAPFDPWIRVHWRLGAETLGIAESAITATGSVSDWEEWTGLTFPVSGEYAVEGALAPIVIDRETGTGIYREPNLWMRHAADSSAGSAFP